MSTADKSVLQDVTQAHRELLGALVEGDTDALETMIAEDCQIIGPKGFHIGKAEWVSAHSSAAHEQVLLEGVRSETRQYGDAAVRSDLQRSECLYQGELIAGLYRVLNVWMNTAHGWQLAAVQYTAVSNEAAARSEDSR